jgi:hypothetical protein
MKGQLEIEFYRIPELDNVRKAVSLLEKVEAELEEKNDFTIDELWKIHNLAKAIRSHAMELKLRAAWNLGRLENERR